MYIICIILLTKHFKLVENPQFSEEKIGAIWRTQYWKHFSNSRNSPVILSLNRFMSASCWVAHTSFWQGKWQCHHPRVASPTMTASTWTHICVTTLLRPCSILFKLFKCSVTSTINARSCIHSVDWNSNTGLPFFPLTVQFPLVNQRNASAQHLGLTILPRCGMVGHSCGLSLWEGCQTDGDSGLWIRRN